METVNNALTATQTRIRDGQSLEQPCSQRDAAGRSTHRTSDKLIDRLFVRVNSNYGHLWSSRFQSHDMLAAAKAEWAIALGRFSAEEIGAGIERCFVKYDKPPSMTEFVKCCSPSPEDLGLPPTETAYREACQNAHLISGHRWSHPAIYVAGKATGWFELRHKQTHHIIKAFERNYVIACRRAMDGSDLNTEIPQAIEHNPSGVVMSEPSRAEKRQRSMKARDIAMAELNR